MALRLSSIINNVVGKHFTYFVEEPESLGLRDSHNHFIETLLGHAITANSPPPSLHEQKQLIHTVREALQNKAVRLRVVPHLPRIIPKLIRSLRDPNSSPQHYKKIIEKDPCISAAVLKLVNSAYFNPLKRRILHIDTAIIKIGTDGLRSVIAAAVMQPVIQQKSAHFGKCNDQLWQHSLLCATACQIIAKQHNQDPVKAYMLGLAHEIGTITLLSELSKHLSNQQMPLTHLDIYTPLIQNMAPALSYWIAKDWELPNDICHALLEQISTTTGDGVSALGYTLHKANLLCEIYESTYQSNPHYAQQLALELNVQEDIFEQLQATTKH